MMLLDQLPAPGTVVGTDAALATAGVTLCCVVITSAGFCICAVPDGVESVVCGRAEIGFPPVSEYPVTTDEEAVMLAKNTSSQ